MPTQSMVPMQIRPLPVSSGRQTPSTRLLDEHNKNLTMLATQSKADQKFDPPPAKRPTQSSFVEKFSATPTAPLTTTLFVPLHSLEWSGRQSMQASACTLFVIGTLLVVYGALAK
jgi:hypothetical protein